MKKFVYLGMEFSPVRSLSPNEDFSTISKRLRSMGVDNYNGNWDYASFYTAAQESGCEDFDIFLYEGRNVIPARNELFIYEEAR